MGLTDVITDSWKRMLKSKYIWALGAVTAGILIGRSCEYCNSPTVFPRADLILDGNNAPIYEVCHGPEKILFVEDPEQENHYLPLFKYLQKLPENEREKEEKRIEQLSKDNGPCPNVTYE